jgi:hypothetical protein
MPLYAGVQTCRYTKSHKERPLHSGLSKRVPVPRRLRNARQLSSC